MSNHTPGQWQRHNHAPYSVWCGDTQIAATRWTYDNGAVASECEKNEARAIANAKLIANAPKIYAAMMKVMVCLQHSTEYKVGNPAFEQAVADCVYAMRDVQS